MRLYEIWVSVVVEDGQISVAFHPTEGDAWSAIIDAYKDKLSEEINLEAISQRIEAMYDEDEDEIRDELGGYGIDIHIEEYLIDPTLLRLKKGS